MVVEADPGQSVVEGHVDSLQSDGAALHVARLEQLCKRIAGQTKQERLHLQFLLRENTTENQDNSKTYNQTVITIYI